MSCLFNSIQFLLKEYDNNISNLRKIVFEYMEENLDELVGGETIKTWIELCNIDENNGMNVQEYINRIKKTDQWGGAPELAVISKIYNIQIQVVLHLLLEYACYHSKNIILENHVRIIIFNVPAQSVLICKSKPTNKFKLLSFFHYLLYFVILYVEYILFVCSCSI